MKKRLLTFLTAIALIAGCIAVPTVEAQAATVNVYSAVSPDPSYQVFYISTDDWAHTRYDLFDGTTWTYDQRLNSSSGELHLDPRVDYDIYVYQVDDSGNYVEGTEVSARSMLAHDYTVSYNLYDASGNLVKTTTEETGTVAIDDSFVFTADEQIEEDGMEYDLSSAYSQLPISYGTGRYTFDYSAYNPAAIEACVYYVDDRGNVLKTNPIALEYYGGNVTFNVEKNITIDGRSYTKFSGPDTVTLNYFSPVLDYDIVYVEDEPAVSYPYTVKINYTDSATGAVLGTQYETITAEDSSVDEVQLTVPGSLEISSNGSVFYYHADQTVIGHDPEGTVRSYDVPYSLFDQQTPYYWDIRLVDSASGSLLDETLIEIPVDETRSYTPEAQINVNGTDYILNGAMSASYDRHYDDPSSRILYVYYNQVGTVIDSEQVVNISFRSVSDNTVLFSEEVTVPAGSNYSREIPDTYDANGTQYVKLAGQDEALVYNYNTPQRDLTAYYRDVNDLQNVDTVVTQEETIYYDVPVIEEETVLTPVTVITNPTTGETQTYTPAGELVDQTTTTPTEEIEDEQVPQGNQDLNQSKNNNRDTQDNAGTENIDDEEVPKANQDLTSKSGVNPFLIGGISVAAAAVLVILYILISKKRKENGRK